MATVSDQTYFPPLEDCLNGRTCVISWSIITSALSDPTRHQLTSPAIAKFLRDPFVHRLLKAPSSVFGTRTNESSDDYNTRTSAIHVAPTPNSRFDIKQIKDDASWLSANVGISEVAALRIVVIELQSRPRSHLGGPLSSQDVANIQDAAGLSNAQASSLLVSLNVSTSLDADQIWSDFHTEEARRQRITATYLSERRNFAMAADYTVAFLLMTIPGARDPVVEAVREDLLQGIAHIDDERTGVNTNGFEGLLMIYLDLLPSLIDSSQDGPGSIYKSDITVELQADWVTTFLSEAIHGLSLITQVVQLAGNIFAVPEHVSRWFRLMDDYAFLDRIVGPPELLAPLRSLVCVISMSFLNLERSLPYLARDIELRPEEDPYVDQSAILSQVHATIFGAAEANVVTAGPVIFTWALIVHRLFVGYQERAEERDLLQNQRAQDGFELDMQHPPVRRNSAGSIVSIEKSPYDLFLVNQNLDRDIEPVERMATAVTAHGQVFEQMAEMALCMGNNRDAAFRPTLGNGLRKVLLHLIKHSYPILGYQADSLTCLLAVLSGGQRYWDLSRNECVPPDQTVVAAALRDEAVMDLYVRQALVRYPYEYSPFVSLCRTLRACSWKNERSDKIKNWIEAAPSLTLELPKDWGTFELTQDEENSMTFQLTQDLQLFQNVAAWRRHDGTEDSFRVPAGTCGRFFSDVGKVVLLGFEHSVLELSRKQMEARLSPDSVRTEFRPLDFAETTEAISLGAVCLRMSALDEADEAETVAAPPGLALARAGRQDRSEYKDDFVSIVCDMVDSIIQDDFTNSNGCDVATLSSCLQVLHAALHTSPGRVWSYLARCGLLNGDSRAGRLSRISGNMDLVRERYDLMVSALKLFQGLVESVLRGAVQRQSNAEPNHRQRMSANPWLGTSEKLLAQVCLSAVQATVEILENTTTWRFESDLDRSALVGDAIQVLDKVVSLAYSVSSLAAGDEQGNAAKRPEEKQAKGLTACFLPAAACVVDSFLSSSFGQLRCQPLLATLVTALQIPSSTIYLQRVHTISEAVSAVLHFFTTLLRAVDYLEKPPSAIQAQLFKCVSLVARLIAMAGSFQIAAVDMLSALLESSGAGEAEPPSLLGYLGPQVSRSFIQVMSTLDQPYDRMDQVVATWRFMSSVMRSRQRWMSNCLLTGRTPKEAAQNDGQARQLSSESVLARAIEGMRNVQSMPSRKALAILEFFTSAQNYWPWIVFSIQDDRAFFDDLRAYVRNLKPPAYTLKTDAEGAALQARIAAFVAESFAMHLYHMRQLGRQSTLAADLINDVDYFLRDAVQVSAYNTSLHVNFAKNFGAQYAHCSLDNFIRTSLFPRELGSSYFYAVELAQSMLGSDFGWKGGIRGTGFRHEMEMANLNLSLVEAQVALFRAWEYLLLELGICLLPANKTIAVQMLQVAQKCLESNQDFQPPQDIFVRLTHSRGKLALTLLQRLAEHSLLPADVTLLLSTVWTTICGVETPYRGEQLPYYQTLLRILFVSLRASAHSKNSDASATRAVSKGTVSMGQLVLGILDRVVAQGFRTLAAMVHEPNTPTGPEDIALITAVLQASLSVPGMDQCQTQILNIMASYDVFHVATSLFSWAEKLPTNGDPVFGELALLFLLELSAFPIIAEQLACDGLLGHITSANLAGFIRRPNVSPLAENPGATRCYGIWTKGILPLLLNMLGALGPTIAPEVAYVLNQFPNLLQSSVQRFETPGLSRTAAARKQGGPHQFVTLLAVSEVHSLALLTRALAACRENNTRDVPEVRWDGDALLENVEFWLSSRKVLLDRLLPLGPRETEWRGTKAREGSGYENLLVEKVVVGLETVRDVLGEEAE